MSQRVSILAAGLLAITTVAILSLTYLIASLQNQLAADQSLATVQALLNRERRDLARQVLDYAVWDAAYENLDRRFNQSWAVDKLGPYLATELDIDAALVVEVAAPNAPAGTSTSGDDFRPRFTMLEGQIETIHADSTVATELIELARSAARDHRALPDPTTGYVLLNGRPYVAAASPVGDKARPELASRPGPRTALIFLRGMDAAWFQIFQSGFQFKSISFVRAENPNRDTTNSQTSSPAPGDVVALPLQNAMGRTIGTIQWSPPKPGARLLWILLPAVAAILGLCGTLIFLLLRQWQRLFEQLSVAREAAETANRLKSQFLANVSHEIRTPMTAILGFTEQLREFPELNPQRESSGADALDSIQRNGQHLLHIINDILDLSRLESGVDALQLNPASLALRPFLCETLALLEQKARDRKLALTCEWRAPIPATIQTDSLRLRQILLNLLGNAIKFTNAGFVRLELEHLTATDASVRFTIADSGRGIDLTRHQNILEAFVQSPENTAADGGTGLGLAISNRLVQALGDPRGIQIASAPAAGSRFSFELPVALDQAATSHDSPELLAPQTLHDFANATTPVSNPTPDAPDLTRLSVLIVDDGPDNRTLLDHILQKAGMRPDLACNGREAVQKARVAWESGQQYDAILMDMQMPEVDGYEATRQLRRAGYPGRIFALTAFAMPEDRQRCIDAGCDDYLSKPVARADLLQLLATLVPRSRVPKNASHDANDV